MPASFVNGESLAASNAFGHGGRRRKIHEALVLPMQAIYGQFVKIVHDPATPPRDRFGVGLEPCPVPLPGCSIMSDVSFSTCVYAFVAAFLAGAINSVAGGGTLVSFPVLLALGLPPVVANATNTVGIWPGAFGSVWGFRREMGRLDRRVFWLVLPSLVGGFAGAMLLKSTSSSAFEKVAPWLILFATFLFTIQASVQKYFQSSLRLGQRGSSWLVAAVLAQLCVAVYGGYFGAGMSIMSLSVLGLLGMTEMLEMSATTSLLSFVINGIAGALFVVSGLVHWPIAAAMALGALSGGYGATGIARRIGKVAVRRFVICVGITISATLFLRLLR